MTFTARIEAQREDEMFRAAVAGLTPRLRAKWDRIYEAHEFFDGESAIALSALERMLDGERDADYAAQEREQETEAFWSDPDYASARPRLQWGQRQQVDHKMSAWYDHTFYRVPVVGTIDTTRIAAALNRAWRTSLTGTAVGGYRTCADVADNGDGTVTVEVLYHIGD